MHLLIDDHQFLLHDNYCSSKKCMLSVKFCVSENLQFQLVIGKQANIIIIIIIAQFYVGEQINTVNRMLKRS